MHSSKPIPEEVGYQCVQAENVNRYSHTVHGNGLPLAELFEGKTPSLAADVSANLGEIATWPRLCLCVKM